MSFNYIEFQCPGQSRYMTSEDLYFRGIRVCPWGSLRLSVYRYGVKTGFISNPEESAHYGGNSWPTN